MKPFRLISILVVFSAACWFAQAQDKTAGKEIAVTFDDLPLNIAHLVSDDKMDVIVNRLVKNIANEHIPVVAFVNENKLEVNGVRDSVRVNILKRWLDAGVELGNHTYSHKSANACSAEEYENEIVKGERTLTELLGARPRWFRHPFLHVGKTLEERDSIYQFLHDRGYTVAPVTIDNAEWIFSVAFDHAYKTGSRKKMHDLGRRYVEYMQAKLRYWEGQSQKLFRRNIRQILLIHSNRINSIYFPELCAMIRANGYTFTALTHALGDPAYQTPDTYIGGWGISWLDHWALTQKKPKEFFADEPRVPKDVMTEAGVDSE
jgi:peptidoglycan/xylan/chitin deacetylase (PgdA/CDA1 family)